MKYINFIWLLGAAGCVAESINGTGPTFGGAIALEGAVVDTEVGFLTNRPVDVTTGICEEEICFTTEAAYLPEQRGDLFVALGVEGKLVSNCEGEENCWSWERKPTDLVITLDASGSVGMDDPMHYVLVETTLSEMQDTDSFALTAFTTEPVLLLSPTSVTESTMDLAMEALDFMELIPKLKEILSQIKEVIPEMMLCEQHPGEIEEEINELLESEQLCVEDDDSSCSEENEGIIILQQEEFDDLLYALEVLGEAAKSPNSEIYDAICTLVKTGGTDLSVGMEHGLSLLPAGSVDRSSRLVFASDLMDSDEQEETLEIARAASDSFVGITVMGISDSINGNLGRVLGQLPGGLFLETPEPGMALSLWMERFDLLLRPRAWGLEISINAQDKARWSLEDIFGADDPKGAPTVFASTHHGALGLHLKPHSIKDAQNPPLLDIRWKTPAGEQHSKKQVVLPQGLLRTSNIIGDSNGVLRLYAFNNLYQALKTKKGAGAAYDIIMNIAELLEDEKLRADAELLLREAR